MTDRLALEGKAGVRKSRSRQLVYELRATSQSGLRGQQPLLAMIDAPCEAALFYQRSESTTTDLAALNLKETRF